MQKYEFVRQIEIYKPILWGRGKQVAKLAGIEYPTWQNYSKGIAIDQVIMTRILRACEQIKQELTAEIANINKELTASPVSS